MRSQRSVLVLLVLLVSACTGAGRAKGPKKMEDKLAPTIQEIADRLTDANASVSTLAQTLGSIEQKYTGSGYYLTPNDPRFKSVWVGIKVVGQGREDVTDVTLEMTELARVPVVELDTVFGAHEPVPANPSGRPHNIEYSFDKADKPYTASIYATLNSPADVPGAQAEKISIRRDKR